MAQALSEDQKAALLVWLLDELKTRDLQVHERLALFDSMTVDLGAVSPTYSDRREDWHGEDGR